MYIDVYFCTLLSSIFDENFISFYRRELFKLKRRYIHMSRQKKAGIETPDYLIRNGSSIEAHPMMEPPEGMVLVAWQYKTPNGQIAAFFTWEALDGCKSTMRDLKLHIEAMPQDRFGKNLRLIMGRARWDAFRSPILDEHNHKCDICGSSERLQVHEKYLYNYKKKIQKLVGFEVVCSQCHMVKHIGLAYTLMTQGKLTTVEPLIAHFMAVNECSRTVYELMNQARMTDRSILNRDGDYNRDSVVEWTTDFGEWKGYGTEHILS